MIYLQEVKKYFGLIDKAHELYTYFEKFLKIGYINWGFEWKD